MAISLCGTTVGNTGVIPCDIAPGIPEELYIWNGSKAISSITGTAFQTFLENSSQLSKNDPDKLFVFPVILNVADASTANTTGTLNQGFSQVLVEGKMVFNYKVKVGASTIKQLRKFNNQNVNVLVKDKNKRVWGEKSGDNFIGGASNFFITSLKFATGQAVEEGIVTITVSYLNSSDDLAFGEVTSSSAIRGLVDVPLSETVSHTSNVYKIGAFIPTAKIGTSINLHDTYATALASGSLWVAKTGTNYATTLAITTVTDDTVNSGWTVTFDSTAYGLLSNGAAKIKLTLAAPPVLDAADVSGIESIELLLAKS